MKRIFLNIFKKCICSTKRLRTLTMALLLSFVMTGAVFAQEMKISGSIIDSNGKPLLGVTVSAKNNSSIGTISDVDGNYLIQVNPSEILVFSFIGFITKEMTAKDADNKTITLDEDIRKMNEVVVIGYGTQLKKDLTGSIGNISQEKMNNNASVGIGDNLQGKLAGVQITQNDGTPYGGTTIRIRGTGSFGATNDPLIVIDGMITNDGLFNLNPNDVQDITVLKDAASAAIYGSRGANGVVIVTTKKGNFDSPLKIDFSVYTGVDNLRFKIPTLTAKEYAMQINDYYGAANLPVPYSQSEVDSYGKGTNWIDEITQSGIKTNVSLNISGGSVKNSYAAAINLYKGDGIIKNTDFTRGNLKLSNDMMILPSLKFGSSLNINYGVSNNTDWGQAIDRALIYPPTVPAYETDGQYGICSHNGEPVTMLQPLIAVNLWTFNQTWKKLLGNIYGEWEIVKGLKLKSTLYAEYTNWYQDNFIPSYSYGPSGMISDHPIAQLNVNNNDNLNYEWDNILTYIKTFNQNHSLTAMAGYTFQQSNSSWLWAGRNNFLNNDVNMQVLDAGTDNINNSGSKEAWAIQSYLARVNYDYNKKYLLSASVRIDQTSRISQTNRTGVFPSASAGWVLSEEDFLKNAKPLSYLKVRASWGVLGNQAIGTYPYQTTLNSTDLYYPFGAGNDGTTYTGVGPTSFGNSQLMWEKTSSVGAGVEANFFKNRLSFIGDFYKRFTSNILVQVPILSTAGVGSASPYQNAGACTNTGIELTLEYSNFTTKSPFKYDISINWTSNVNRVTSIPAPIVNNFTRTQVGHSINDWYGYVQDGIFQTQQEIDNSPTQPNAAPGDIKFKDLNGDGKIDVDDQKFLGHSIAPNNFGGSITLGYKNFDLVTNFYGQIGGMQTTDAPGFAITRGGEQTSAWMYRQRWTGEGTSNYVPRVVAGDPNNNYRRSSFWLRSTDFFRLQNIQLGYNFDKLLNSNALKVIKKLRLYIASQNLFCINSFPGFDPEQLIDGYPIPRSFYFGINVGL